MSTTATQTGAGDIDIGRVFSRSFEILFRHLAKFLILTTIAFLPLLAYQLAFQRVPSTQYGAGTLIVLLLVLILPGIAQAAVLFGAFQEMRGKPFSIGESLQKGLVTRILPIIGLAIVVGLGVFFGTMLLIVPGAILATMWYVALPACVLEGVGPFDALSRSSFLTKGCRWKIFGIAVVIAIVTAIAGGVLQGVLFAVMGWVGLILGGFISQIVFGALRGVVVAVLYHDLRSAKEGIDVERIVAVFE